MSDIDTRLETKHVWTLDEVNAAIKRVKTEPNSVLVPHFNEMVAIQRPNNMLTQLYAIKCELLEKALEITYSESEVAALKARLAEVERVSNIIADQRNAREKDIASLETRLAEATARLANYDEFRAIINDTSLSSYERGKKLLDYYNQPSPSPAAEPSNEPYRLAGHNRCNPWEVALKLDLLELGVENHTSPKQICAVIQRHWKPVSTASPAAEEPRPDIEPIFENYKAAVKTNPELAAADARVRARDWIDDAINEIGDYLFECSRLGDTWFADHIAEIILRHAPDVTSLQARVAELESQIATTRYQGAE